jgi:hypothetical protein
MIEYMLVIEIEASLNILRNLKSNFFVNNRMQCMYPLVKVEIVDLFAGERGGGDYLNEYINCVYSLSVR